MRTRFLASGLACALLSVGAVAAFAVPANETTLDFQVKPSSTKAGTVKKPKITNLAVTIKGGTTDGTGQPATSTALNTTLPKQWVINSERWPKSKRCSITQVNQDKDTSSCPSGSKVGSGRSQAKINEGNGEQNLDVTAFVIKNGDIGFFLKNDGGATVNEMIVGNTVNGNKLNVKIPPQIQEPFPGLITGISLLKVNFKGTAMVKGKKIGILATTGCVRRKWKFTVVNVYRDGKNTDTDTVNCTKA